MFKRVFLASLLAVIIASMVSITVLAATAYVSEYGADFSSSGLSNMNPCPSGWVCSDSHAKKAFLSGSTSAWNAWGNWDVPGNTTPAGPITMNAFAFIPKDPSPSSANFAAVIYSFCASNTSGCADTTVNQTNWKGVYVQMNGIGSGSYLSYLKMNNKCAPGFLCSTSMPLYYDKSYFSW